MNAQDHIREQLLIFLSKERFAEAFQSSSVLHNDFDIIQDYKFGYIHYPNNKKYLYLHKVLSKRIVLFQYLPTYMYSL